jgi:hypothetical protein
LGLLLFLISDGSGGFMRVTKFLSLLLLAVPLVGYGQVPPDDQLPPGFMLNTNPHMATANAGGGGRLGNRSNGSVLGVDSVVNWSSSFYYPGFDSFGNTQFAWQYTMVGHSPLAQNDGSDSSWFGDTTLIGAPVIPVNLDLRNADGTIRFVNGHRLYVDATKLVAPILKSPVFSKTSYDSSEDPTQFTDAVSRAEFFKKASDDWHTLLVPRTPTPRTMILLRGTYAFALNSDGTCCRFVLVDENAFVNALFPSTPTDTTTVMGQAENAGDIRTRDISTFLFSDVYLYAGTTANCCTLGFHSYDVEPGDQSNGWKERRYVMNYSSYISPGLFGAAFVDVTALSHEMSETFNDPFVNNATPWWLAPNGVCQNNLETGDVIEGLPNATFPINLNGMTWHPQNEALVQWFAGVTPSSAIHHAYSYPDTTVLSAAAVSQKPGCKP